MEYDLHFGDCLEVMKSIPDASVDCVLTDPPYGTTACKWDSVISFEPMWKELKRIAKAKAAICLFGSQPFTSALVMSNPKMFKYEWVWNKKLITGFLNSKHQPLRQHENILVFCEGKSSYYPEFHSNKLPRDFTGSNIRPHSALYGHQRQYVSTVNAEQSYPRSIIESRGIVNNSLQKVGHPTQKPVELLRYLIRTYTLEGETVLDFTMGSGSTGVACQLENRNFIGIENNAEYFAIAEKRIADVVKKEPLFMTV